jgi:hypothetical protein
VKTDDLPRHARDKGTGNSCKNGVLHRVFCDQQNWRQQIQQLLRSRSSWAVLVVSRGSVVAAAVVQCSITPLECTIRMMATFPRERRRGFGRLLDSYLHLHAARCGMHRVAVEVSTRSGAGSGASSGGGTHASGGGSSGSSDRLQQLQQFWRVSVGYRPMSLGERSSAGCHACLFKNTQLLVRSIPPAAHLGETARRAREASQLLRADQPR